MTAYPDEIDFMVYGIPEISFGTHHRLPRSKVPPGSPLDVMSDDDPSGGRRLVDAVVSARRDGEGPAARKHLYAGVVDLMATVHADDDLRREFGDRVHAVPFTAAVDDRGRLVEFVIKLDALAPRLETIRAAWGDFGRQLNP